MNPDRECCFASGSLYLTFARSALSGFFLLHAIDRHDEEWEKEQDRIREDIKASHRFQSFASERSENAVKW